MAEVECFMVEETDRQRRFLRRFTFKDEGECPVEPMGHEARTQIEDGPALKSDDGYWLEIPVEEFDGDDRWPTGCACGYEFTDDDERQVLGDAIYTLVEGDGEWSQRELPPGAMFNAWWHPRKGPDGLSLAVVLPGGSPDARTRIWVIDSEASSGGHWTREGAPPKVTANPSILAGDYHGWLRNGKLVEC